MNKHSEDISRVVPCVMAIFIGIAMGALHVIWMQTTPYFHPTVYPMIRLSWVIITIIVCFMWIKWGGIFLVGGVVGSAYGFIGSMMMGAVIYPQLLPVYIQVGCTALGLVGGYIWRRLGDIKIPFYKSGLIVSLLIATARFIYPFKGGLAIQLLLSTIGFVLAFIASVVHPDGLKPTGITRPVMYGLRLSTSWVILIVSFYFATSSYYFHGDVGPDVCLLLLLPTPLFVFFFTWYIRRSRVLSPR